MIDDHELVWNGTRRLLEGVARESASVGELHFSAVRDVEAACQLARSTGPGPFDLVLLDYHLPGVGGLAALKRIQAAFEGVIVCMLSGESGAEQIRAVLDAGAAGFIPKSYGEPEMASALRLVLRHKVYVPAEFLFAEEVVRGRAADEVPSEDLTAFLRSELSQRQRQVLALALRGLPNKRIARQLQIAEGTVKVHLSMVYRALGVHNRVGALCRVLQADAAGALE
ncbi:MAG: response regulator transcription factor [Burkholderiales bacterium]|nr:response regulator transcription factor [Burkholderiales bacterium]MDE2275613.1 response regulator transcription factor [Burkholderiales bacterium]